MNRLTLAVAGGRKTQSIIEECSCADAHRRILVLTYTQANQQEVRDRLARLGPLACAVDVQGWFSFLMAHWIRPYLPLRFMDKRLRGLNFDGDPGQYATGESRFLDSEDRAYRRHLAHLAFDVNEAAGGASIDRLGRLYDTIYVDEVQDLNGYDLEVLEALILSAIELRLVGDIRQAILLTNVKDPKNKQYKGAKIKDWFAKQATAGRLLIEYRCTTWRSSQLIAELADSAFDATWGFPATVSKNMGTTGHDGVFAVATRDAMEYFAIFAPLCLRHNRAVGNEVDLPYINFGIAKGMDSERVLIWPTQGMVDFLRKGKAMKTSSSCTFYVAVTRARASVAFIRDDPAVLGLPVWTP